MKRNSILENIKIEKLIFGGKGLAYAPDGKKIIISGGVIPGSIINLRILKNRKTYYEAQMLDQVIKSSLEQELPSHFQIYGGCKWLPIKYEDQLKIKEGQVKESYNNIQENIKDTKFNSIIPSPEIYGYRNKLEFSWGKYISAKEEIYDEFRFGFHKQGAFDRIIDCSYCVLADDEINDIFKDVDKFSRESGASTYDPKTYKGFWRHFVVRKTKFLNEIMLIFSVNDKYLEVEDSGFSIKKLIDYSNNLAKKFPNIKSIYHLNNNSRADIVTGEYNLIYGSVTIGESLLGLRFEINPKSFFQTNSAGAEALYSEAFRMYLDENKKGGTMLDLYAGTGTIGMIFSKYFDKVYSVELVTEASKDGEKNAGINGLKNIEFINKKVEDFLGEFINSGNIKADLLMIDPPRSGMHPSALPNILKFNAQTIIYVSCNPSTLARDLEYIVKNSLYKIKEITPVDMFPHTHHIETIAKLTK